MAKRRNPPSGGSRKVRGRRSPTQNSNPEELLKLCAANTNPDEAWPPEFCRQVLMRSPWPMCVLDAGSYRVVEVNDAALRYYAMERAEFMEHGVDVLNSGDSQQRVKRNLELGLRGPVSERLTEHLLPDGTLLPVEMMAFPLLWKGRPARFVIVRDPLSRAIAEGSALPTEGLDLLARVSGTIAHDLNNLLMVINATACDLVASLSEPLRMHAELIKNTADSAERLAGQLLCFGRKQPGQPRKVDLNALLDEYREMMRVVVGRAVELEIIQNKNLGATLIDPLQVRELLLNLVINARDAMPQGGKLRISTQDCIVSDDEPELGLMTGHYARLTVEDNGLGMDKATQLRAFEPYFTTKEKGRRSGLGLASVDNVVRQSGGAVQLTSKLGEGTQFDIYLPCLPPAARARPRPDSPSVLLIEDQAELRNLLEEFLTNRGYTVIACASGEEGVIRARGLERAPAIVLTDVVMSGMTGRDVLDKMRELFPAVPALFISGHVHSIGRMPGECRDTAFLQKPFSLEAVRIALERLLGSADAPSSR